MSDADEIRNLIASYSHAADDQRFDDYGACFAVDGEFVVNDLTMPQSKLASLARSYAEQTAKMPQPTGTRHLVINSKIEVSGDKASAVSDFLGLGLSPEGWSISGVGRYTDEFVRRGGRWLIKKRTLAGHKGLPLNPAEPQSSELVKNVQNKVLKG
jgi:3-phenylpropionate/cinnamic acid dioxygenase small subunit